jgi:hypothetical protein
VWRKVQTGILIDKLVYIEYSRKEAEIFGRS